MADLLGIGTSGLLAYQQALTTTSHNISNVNTEGYSRQTVSMSTREPNYVGVGFMGSGVATSEIKRNYDNFLVEQVRSTSSSSETFSAYYELSRQIDNLLADPDAGLTPMMGEFFASTQGVADNPSSIPARQVMLSNAESLVDRFNYIDQRLRDLNSRANRQLEVSVDEINSYANVIANLNQKISQAIGQAGGKDPNDLLDQRDHVLTQLSSLVNIKTLEQEDGQVNVFIGSGQGLVVGATTLTLGVRADDMINDKMKVVIDDGGSGIDISRLLTGGRVGGTLNFLGNVLAESRNALGRIGAGISEQVNNAHSVGIDLTNTLGGDFFTPASIFVQPNNTNAATGAPTVEYADTTALTTNDYMLEHVAGSWVLSDYNSGNTIPWSVGSGTAVDPYIVDGMSIDLSTIAGAANGDQYILRPTSDVVSGMGVEVKDPTRIAAAGALSGEAVSDVDGMPLNGGNGVIHNVTPADNSSLPLPATVTLTYDAVGQQFNVVGAVPAVIAYDPLTDGSVSQTLTVGTMNINFEFTGTPQTGDQFIIDNNLNATGDNRGALAIASLQTEKTLINGSATFQSAYGQIVSKVGTQTHQADINMRAAETLHEQAFASMQEVSGVNLDEEAADLIKYQQAYQASAQVITTANTLFQSLLQMF